MTVQGLIKYLLGKGWLDAGIGRYPMQQDVEVRLLRDPNDEGRKLYIFRPKGSVDYRVEERFDGKHGSTMTIEFWVPELGINQKGELCELTRIEELNND